MSKRRINIQQTARIKKIQSAFQLSSDLDNATREDGLVLTRYGKHAFIENSLGKSTHCSIRPHIDSLVAGDRVVWQTESKNQGVVISRYPRETVLGRPDKRGVLKPVAANITQVLVVVAPKPEVSWSLLDSYLVMAESFNLNVSIIVNKIDLSLEQLPNKLLTVYQELGYPVLLTSTEKNMGLNELIEQLNNQASVFVGQSGVGKSSLISRVLPDEERIQISAISASSELGCHTTTNSYFYHLPSGGALIDSPGVRELGLWHMPATEIAKGYLEFKPLLSECKFRNCNHRQDPGCAIVDGVKKGTISTKRYENYVKITSQFAK